MIEGEGRGNSWGRGSMVSYGENSSRVSKIERNIVHSVVSVVFLFCNCCWGVSTLLGLLRLLVGN